MRYDRAPCWCIMGRAGILLAEGARRLSPVHLLSAWPEVQERLTAAPGVLIGLDFDGTLAPIALRPDLAVPPEETRKVLERLAAIPGMEVAVISGRGLEDLKSRVGLPGLTYGANHGLEIERRGALWTHPIVGRATKAMAQIEAALRPAVRHIPGALLDPKQTTMSIHYRQVKSPRNARLLKEVVQATIQPWLDRGDIRVTGGKMLVELRPNTPWAKGHCLAFLLTPRERPSAEGRPSIEDAGGVPTTAIAMDAEGAYTGPRDGRLAFYAGDDQTDEDGFKAIRAFGVTVKVGSPTMPTAAAYRVWSPAELLEVLERMVTLLGAGR